MANGNQLPEGFVLDQPDSGLPEGFVLDVPSETIDDPFGYAGREVSAAPDIPALPGGVVMSEDDPRAPAELYPGAEIVPTSPNRGIVDAFTGESRMTPSMRGMKEIGAAPELNEMSVPAFKAAFGLMTTGDTESLKGVLKKQYGENVGFLVDEKGNTIVDFPSGQYALNMPGLSGQDLARGVMDFLAFTPASRAATIPTAIAKSAATEAALESGEAAVGGDFSPEEVALAAGVGGAFKTAETALGAGYRALFGKADDQMVQAGREAGIPVFTSDVRPPKTFAGKTAQQTGEKIPIAGTGGLRESQQELRKQAVADISDRYGQFSYQSIVDSLKTQRDRVKKAAGDVLETTGNKLDSLGEIPITNTVKAISDVTEELTKKGVIKSGQALDDLQTLAQSIKEAPQTFSTLKENRTAFREIVKGADKAERSQLTSRAKALLQRVDSSMKKDMDAFAKGNLTDVKFSVWKKANQTYAEEATKMTKTRLKNILDKGDVTPENVQTMLFSQKPSEVRTLYNSLTDEGRENARSAIISKVVTDLNKRAAGLSPNTFASELKKYGLQTNEFFKGEEKRSLNGLLKVLDATRRAQEAAVTTPTGQQLLGAGTLAALATDFGITIGLGGTLGGFARLYESAPVRNALLRLDSIPKGSTRYDKALAEAIELLTAGAQTAREQIQDNQ